MPTNRMNDNLSVLRDDVITSFEQAGIENVSEEAIMIELMSRITDKIETLQKVRPVTTGNRGPFLKTSHGTKFTINEKLERYLGYEQQLVEFLQEHALEDLKQQARQRLRGEFPQELDDLTESRLYRLQNDPDVVLGSMSLIVDEKLNRNPKDEKAQMHHAAVSLVLNAQSRAQKSQTFELI